MELDKLWMRVVIVCSIILLGYYAFYYFYILETQNLKVQVRTLDGVVSEIKIEVKYEKKLFEFRGFVKKEHYASAFRNCLGAGSMKYMVTDFFEMQQHKNYAILNKDNVVCVKNHFEKFDLGLLLDSKIDEIVFNKRILKIFSAREKIDEN